MDVVRISRPIRLKILFMGSLTRTYDIHFAVIWRNSLLNGFGVNALVVSLHQIQATGVWDSRLTWLNYNSIVKPYA